MAESRNGMPAQLLGGARWGESSYSGAVGNCVELAWLADGQVAVRNSRAPHGPALLYPRADVEALVAKAKQCGRHPRPPMLFFVRLSRRIG